ncbi:hypothetical protein C8R44DRAFT_887526 [Mycena epipterygia]|nr:hypothetical protein C8R44DRAFT_887526 [Mycena epipterygia]
MQPPPPIAQQQPPPPPVAHQAPPPVAAHPPPAPPLTAVAHAPAGETTPSSCRAINSRHYFIRCSNCVTTASIHQRLLQEGVVYVDRGRLWQRWRLQQHFYARGQRISHSDHPLGSSSQPALLYAPPVSRIGGNRNGELSGIALVSIIAGIAAISLLRSCCISYCFARQGGSVLAPSRIFLPLVTRGF